MSRLRMLLVTFVAVFALGAVGASAANAASGHIETDIGGCDFIGTTGTVSSPDAAHSNWDNGVDITGLAPDPNGTCGVPGFSGTLHLHWDNSGDAEVVGDLTAPGLFGDCSYSGVLTGTFDSSTSTFELDPSGQNIDNYSGFLCPDPVEVIDPTHLTL